MRIILFPSLTGVIRFLIILRCGYLGLAFLILFPSLTGVIRFLMNNYARRSVNG